MVCRNPRNVKVNNGEVAPFSLLARRFFSGEGSRRKCELKTWKLCTVYISSRSCDICSFWVTRVYQYGHHTQSAHVLKAKPTRSRLFAVISAIEWHLYGKLRCEIHLSCIIKRLLVIHDTFSEWEHQYLSIFPMCIWNFVSIVTCQTFYPWHIFGPRQHLIDRMREQENSDLNSAPVTWRQWGRTTRRTWSNILKHWASCTTPDVRS